MDSIKNKKYTFFITDNNYILPKENDNIIIHKYFDVSKNRLFSFTFQNNDLFIILNQNTFGSAFFGNTVLTEPKYFIIKKFNPIFILIQILYTNHTEGESNTKNKKVIVNEFVDINAIIQKYEDKLKDFKNKDDKSSLFNNNYDLIFKSSLSFVKLIFEKYSKNIELIAEIKEISKDLAGNTTICAKKCESKVYNYLNTKVNLSPSENKEIEESGVQDKEEKDILTKRKIYEKITILEPFLPIDLYKNYLNYKHIDFLSEDEISNHSTKKENKRKNDGEKNNKRRNKKKGNEEISKNQKSLFDMYNLTKKE